MPKVKLFGIDIPANDVGDRQVKANPVSKAALPPIQPGRIRNGLPPHVMNLNQMHEHANFCALYHGKLICSGPDFLVNTPSSASGSHVRRRFMWRSSPYAHGLFVMASLYPPNSNHGNDTYAKLTLYSDATESVEVASAEFHYGPGPFGSTTARGWQHIKTVTTTIDGISPSTTYHAKVSNENYGRLQSILVFELNSLTESEFGGYFPMNMTAQSSVLSVYRERQLKMTRELWTKGAGNVLTWDVGDHDTPRTTSSETGKNVVDDSSTAISASTPGYTIDLYGHDRISQTSGVPVKMAAFGHMDGAGTGGRVYLKDSAGNTVLSIVDQWTGTTPTWKTTTGFLPATASAKYDLHVASAAGGGTFSLYSIVVFEED